MCVRHVLHMLPKPYYALTLILLKAAGLVSLQKSTKQRYNISKLRESFQDASLLPLVISRCLVHCCSFFQIIYQRSLNKYIQLWVKCIFIYLFIIIFFPWILLDITSRFHSLVYKVSAVHMPLPDQFCIAKIAQSMSPARLFCTHQY